MQKPIPGFSKYLIDENGVVVEIETGAKVCPTTNSRGHIQVQIFNDAWKLVYLHLARALLSAFKPLASKRREDFSSVVYKDGNSCNIRLDNLEWTSQLYHPPYIPGVNLAPNAFVPILGFPSYEINLTGVVRNIRRGTEVTVVRSKVGSEYIRVDIVDRSGALRNIGVHRLLALTFIPHPFDTDHLVINHRDGNRGNNALHNLEWATYSDNITHAYRTGLRTDVDAVLIKSVETGEITEFPSLGEAARFFRCNPGAIWHHLNMKAEPWPWRGYYLKYAKDDTPWPTEASFTRRPMSEEYPVVIRNITTGDIERYASLADAGRRFGVTGAAVKFQADKPKAEPWKGHYVRYDGTNVVWPEYTAAELYVLALRNNVGNPIRVKNLETGDVCDYPSVGSFSRKLGFAPKMVHEHLKKFGRYKHYEISYLGNILAQHTAQ